jgi:hypothetical protein
MLTKQPLLYYRRLEQILKAVVFTALMSGVAMTQSPQRESQPRRPLAPESASSSAEQKEPPFQSPKIPINCEEASRYMDDAIGRSARTKESYLIVVIRPGLHETAQKLNSMRLMQIKGYLDYTRFERFVVSFGERTDSTGRIELYVEGKLLYTFPLRKNRGFDLQSCVGI